MSTTNLAARIRTGTGKGVARSLRRKGRIPAVLYGPELDGTVHLSVDAHDAELLFRSVSVENTIINLEVENGTGSAAGRYRTLVREVQTHPWKGSLLHVDFLRVRRGVTVDLMVPVRLVGTPVGVEMGGVLEQVVHDLPVRCTPGSIPDAVEVDVSRLAIGDSLTVGDIELGAGVEVTVESGRTLCSLAGRRITEDDEAEEEEDPTLALR